MMIPRMVLEIVIMMVVFVEVIIRQQKRRRKGRIENGGNDKGKNRIRARISTTDRA